MNQKPSQYTPSLAIKYRVLIAAVTAVAVLATTTQPAFAFEREGECEFNPFPDSNPGPGSLKSIRPIDPTNLGDFVRDRQAAIALGKALFWDMQVGSDGIQSCGTCHFRAGADPRSKNQLAPGGLHNTRRIVDLGSNIQLTSQHFPLHKVADPSDRHSTLLHDYDDIVASQGVKSFQFTSTTPGGTKDNGSLVADSVFAVGGTNVRRSEPRNTPTVFNAAFNRRNFWDGRADHIFNGVNPFGVRDPDARVLKSNLLGQLSQVKVRIDNASLASQAVGPPLSDLEMGFFNRPMRDVGKRLVSAIPLKNQKVHPDDSVLAPYTIDLNVLGLIKVSLALGLNKTYGDLISKAFKPEWWSSTQVVEVAPNGTATFKPRPLLRPLAANEYTMAEYNFSLFFGLAIQLYEATLISDDAPIDRFFEGNPAAISAKAVEGMELFADNGCAGCHAGAEFTNASTRILNGAEGEPGEIVERMITGNCETGIYDQSFYNIGVRPIAEDLGIGGDDPYGNPLSIAKLLTMDRNAVPSQELLSISYPNILSPPAWVGERVTVMGAFKVPSLRNIALTAPYFHNGGQATLKQVVQFYNRGGDFRDQNVSMIDLEIGKLNLTDSQVDALVEFLNTLTDQRVVQQKAPFDHPQLFVPNGHAGDTLNVTRGADGSATDQLVEIPAVGRNGGPLAKAFLEP